MKLRNPKFLASASILLLCFGVLGTVLWYHLARKGAPAIYENSEEHFKYGAIGLKQGFPYYLWVVMPEVFADLLPQAGGWEVFGFINEGRGYPVGFAKQTVGFPGLTPNCALCHTGRYRESGDKSFVVVPGAPAGALDFKAFNNFVFSAAEDPRFNADGLLSAIQKRFELSISELLVYRYILLPTVKKTLIKQHQATNWMSNRPEPGRGRFDAFNLFKISVLGLPDDGSIGTSDYPPLWNQAARDGQYLHWNGSSNSLHEDNLMSVYPLNLGPSGFLPESFEKVTSYLHSLPPAKYPFAIDAVRAKKGRAIYMQHCSDCHSFEGNKVGQVTEQVEVGTDSEFLSMWSDEFVTSLKAINSPPFHFPGLRQTNGYLNVPLDGAWMRAPYLHNGSVPTLRALLTPVENRPKKFSRGSEVIDPVDLGFQYKTSSSVSESLFDTSQRGNSNAGHKYGDHLTDEEKTDLIEFIKQI